MKRKKSDCLQRYNVQWNCWNSFEINSITIGVTFGPLILAMFGVIKIQCFDEIKNTSVFSLKL